MNKTLLAYFAGVIDSDGTIGIKKSTYAMRIMKDSSQPAYSERICVRQVEPQAVKILHHYFKGSFYMTKGATSRNKPLFTWAITDQRAVYCLRAIYPFLRLKKKQATNCLQLRRFKTRSKKWRIRKSRGHVGAAIRPVRYSKLMETCYRRAKQLNRVGRGIS